MVNCIAGMFPLLEHWKCLLFRSPLYLDDFLPLELDEARSGIGESEVGGAEPLALLRLEVLLLGPVLLELEAGLLEAAAEAGLARASAALKLKKKKQCSVNRTTLMDTMKDNIFRGWHGRVVSALGCGTRDPGFESPQILIASIQSRLTG